ncbi:MAG: TIGR00374 family protein, partial [Mycobacterium sp.]
AISAMLVYRLISWIFIAVIGWVIFFFMFRTEKDIDPDTGPVVVPVAVVETTKAAQFSPDPEAPHPPGAAPSGPAPEDPGR